MHQITQQLRDIEVQLKELNDTKRSFSQRPSANQSSCLAKVNWLRVVLDEAHIIKERTTKTAKAVFLLNSQKRWCMTGTPIQNKGLLEGRLDFLGLFLFPYPSIVEDLYSLVRFLQVPQYQEPQYWTSAIARPLKHNDSRARERLQNLLSDILLRRTKVFFGCLFFVVRKLFPCCLSFLYIYFCAHSFLLIVSKRTRRPLCSRSPPCKSHQAPNRRFPHRRTRFLQRFRKRISC